NQIKNGGDYEMIVGIIQNSMETLSKWHAKWRNILPNGELRWHEDYGTTYCLPDGTYLFNSMIFDITNEIKVTNLYEKTSKLAKIGSWELNLIDQKNDDKMYWSPMVKEILEVEGHYETSLSGGIEFYTEKSKIIV